MDVTNNIFTDDPVTFTTSSDPSLNEPGFAEQKPAVDGIGGDAEKPLEDLPTLRIYNCGDVRLIHDEAVMLNVGEGEAVEGFED